MDLEPIVNLAKEGWKYVDIGKDGIFWLWNQTHQFFQNAIHSWAIDMAAFIIWFIIWAAITIVLGWFTGFTSSSAGWKRWITFTAIWWSLFIIIFIFWNFIKVSMGGA